MGGDSAGVDGYWNLTACSAPKVFLRGEFLIGYTTSFRMGQLLQFSFSPPTPHEAQDIFGFMVVDFVNALRQCLKDGGWAEKEKERENAGNFLVGFRGRLFELQCNYQVLESTDNYLAVGCGEPYAKGSFHATTGSKRTPEERIRMALSAAEHHSAGVCGPFVVLSV